mmetsp:Transcript_35644/g.70492  ORF Transcript_35644/g.70492 Transcript_35644/m.70492 type:complete len:736 (+) Transcript_35644:70-2277(+)
MPPGAQIVYQGAMPQVPSGAGAISMRFGPCLPRAAVSTVATRSSSVVPCHGQPAWKGQCMVREASLTRADFSANGLCGGKQGSEKPGMAASNSRAAITSMTGGGCCAGPDAWPQSPESRLRKTAVWQGKAVTGAAPRLPSKAIVAGAPVQPTAPPDAGQNRQESIAALPVVKANDTTAASFHRSAHADCIGHGPRSWTASATSFKAALFADPRSCSAACPSNSNAAESGSSSSRTLRRCETAARAVMRQVSVPAGIHEFPPRDFKRLQTPPMTLPANVVSHSARGADQALVAGAGNGKQVEMFVQPHVLPSTPPGASQGCHRPAHAWLTSRVIASRTSSPLRPRSSAVGLQQGNCLSGVASPPTCPPPGGTGAVQPPRVGPFQCSELPEASTPPTARETGGFATPGTTHTMSQWPSMAALADDNAAQDMYCQNEQSTPSKQQGSPSPEQQAPGQLTEEEKIAYEDLQFVEHLGSGEFGQVFRGFFRGTEVAIKQLYWDNAVLPEMVVQDFTREIESFRHLRHKRLVSFGGACLEIPNLCIVTEYCPGGSLHHLLHVRKLQLPLLHGTNMCLQLADGVLYLHSQNPVVVHRDLKSLNVVLDLRLNLKLCDFGLTQCMERTHITKKNNGGSPRYMAPELFDSNSKITEKVDIWSTGCIFSEIFGGPLPYDGINTLADLTREMLVNRRTPVIPGHVAEPIQNIIRSCYNFDFRLRPSARQIFEHFRDAKKSLRAQGVL